MASRYTCYYEVDASGNGKLSSGTPISTYRVEDSFPPLDLSHRNLLHIFFTNYAKKEVVCTRKGDTVNEWLEDALNLFDSYVVAEKQELPISNADKGKEIPNADKGKEIPNADEGKEIPNADEGKEFPNADEGKELPNTENEKELPNAENKKELPNADHGKKLPNADKGKEVRAFSFIPKFRNFLGGIIRGVCYIHKRGYSIKDLTEDNISILDDEVKLWKLNLIKTSKESRIQTFQTLADIISTILEHPKFIDYECSPDVTNLLEVLRSGSAAMNDNKILRHMAIVSPEMRLMLVVEMFQMGRCMETVVEWTKATEAFFIEANLNNWKVKYKNKMIGHVLDCYNYRNDYTVKLGKDGVVTKTDVVNSFLNFLRNLAYHGGEDKEARTHRSKEAIDAILFWGFGDEIIFFMECLDRFGLTSDFGVMNRLW